MRSTIYWTMQHSRRAVHDFRFRATCWWLNQQVEFLEWRMRREAPTILAESKPVPTAVGQAGQYVVHSM
jgi:hypothetical protein